MADPATQESGLGVDVTWSLEDARAWGMIVTRRHAAFVDNRAKSRKWGQVIALGGLIVASAAAFGISRSPAIPVAGAILGYLLTVAGQWAYHRDQQGPGMIDVIFQNDPLSYAPRRFEIVEAVFVERRPGLTCAME